jgi:hypothetical protein
MGNDAEAVDEEYGVYVWPVFQLWKCTFTWRKVEILKPASNNEEQERVAKTESV